MVSIAGISVRLAQLENSLGEMESRLTQFEKSLRASQQKLGRLVQGSRTGMEAHASIQGAQREVASSLGALARLRSECQNFRTALTQ